MKVQYNGFRGGIYSCHQTQHDNYLKFIIWCVYLPGITKFCNYPSDICDKRMIGSDIYDPEKQEQNIKRQKSQT
jgi:hypothetical protein